MIMQLPLKECLKKADATEKEAFLSILYTLLSTENLITDQKEAFINLLATEISTTISVRSKTLTPTMCLKLAKEIKSRRLALELIKYMQYLSYSDDSFDNSETSFTAKIASELHLSDKELSSITSWVIDYCLCLEQENIIFETDEA